MIKNYAHNFSERPKQDQSSIVWKILLCTTTVDVDDFINDHKDGWIGDAGLLARKLSLAKQSQL